MSSVFVILGIAVLLTACGSDDGAESDSSAGNMVTVDFPHYPGAEQTAGVELGSDQLPFDGTDAIATLHVANGEGPMAIASHYGADIGNGWAIRDGTQTEYIAYRILTKEERVAMLTLVPGRVAESFPDVLDSVDLGPFQDDADDPGEDETLIYTLIATCNEVEVNTCVEDAFSSYRPDT